MPPNGPIRLLNQEELEARVDPWLKAADWTRAVCGKTIFTWNAFRIECNPQSVIETIKAFDLLSDDIREGAPYQDTLSRDAAIIVQERDGKTFAVVLKVDADAVRRARAKSDVIVGEILAQPVTFEEALSKRSDEEISGTVSVTFDADSVGNTWRRTKVTKLTTKRMDGRSEDYISTDIVERRLIH